MEATDLVAGKIQVRVSPPTRPPAELARFGSRCRMESQISTYRLSHKTIAAAANLAEKLQCDCFVGEVGL